ncbi:MAG: hypothetical protein ACO3TV_06420, partial [Ilumatobacteraceae bacterium]
CGGGTENEESNTPVPSVSTSETTTPTTTEAPIETSSPYGLPTDYVAPAGWVGVSVVVSDEVTEGSGVLLSSFSVPPPQATSRASGMAVKKASVGEVRRVGRKITQES